MHTFQSLSAILHDEPHNICAVFVADLHLSVQSSALNAAFLALIEQLIELPNLRDLYILGDWLDAWLGDDALVQNSRLIPIISALKTLSLRTNISVMHGNRDFMIGRALCAQFNAQLLPQPKLCQSSWIRHPPRARRRIVYRRCRLSALSQIHHPPHHQTHAVHTAFVGAKKNRRQHQKHRQRTKTAQSHRHHGCQSGSSQQSHVKY